MAEDPIALFQRWLEEAEAGEPNDANAMALATADAQGRPAARMVLLKACDERGFAFYTNAASRKGEEIAANPHAALLFHWKSLRRQVRAEGRIEQVSEKEADAYFATRSRQSRLSAWASDQSRPLPTRDVLEARFAEMEARFDGAEVARPPYWKGFRLVPRRIEFWSDRPHRMHERRLFVRAPGSGSGAGGEAWRESLLYP
ncbi:MAG: pyridoxamine 5'-phosphate oxidase [Sphingomonadaceae bacterium]